MFHFSLTIPYMVFCNATSVECMVGSSLTCLEMISSFTYVGGIADSLDFLYIGLHAFIDEYGATECYSGVFYLTLSAIEYKTIVAGYLHYVEDFGIFIFL